jgi:small subunit ribosomal protein S34
MIGLIGSLIFSPSAMSNITRSLQRLLPQASLPPVLKHHPANLYQVLSRTPSAVGKEMHQIRWSEKHISDSYWRVTRTQFKCNGTHGKAWGQLYWKGQLPSSLSDGRLGTNFELKVNW